MNCVVRRKAARCQQAFFATCLHIAFKLPFHASPFLQALETLSDPNVHIYYFKFQLFTRIGSFSDVGRDACGEVLGANNKRAAELESRSTSELNCTSLHPTAKAD